MSRILVGIDGSTSSKHALAWAAGEARRRDAALIVLHAWSVPAMAYGTSTVPFLLPDQDRLTFATSARALMDEMLAEVDLAGIEVDVRLVGGHAGRALLEAAGDAALIVLGASSRGSLSELVLGSTARFVRRRADVPVVVVPAGIDEGRAAA